MPGSGMVLTVVSARLSGIFAAAFAADGASQFAVFWIQPDSRRRRRLIQCITAFPRPKEAFAIPA
jgi:hypothetical protein